LEKRKIPCPHLVCTANGDIFNDIRHLMNHAHKHYNIRLQKCWQSLTSLTPMFVRKVKAYTGFALRGVCGGSRKCFTCFIPASSSVVECSIVFNDDEVSLCIKAH
jgi:hypothetical protein